MGIQTLAVFLNNKQDIGALMSRRCHLDSTEDDPEEGMRLYTIMFSWKFGEWDDLNAYFNNYDWKEGTNQW